MKELDKIKQHKQELLTYVKDEYKEEATNAIAALLSAQAQSDVEAVELVVPVKSVVRRIDLGTCELLQSTYGILFTAKGSMSTLIKPSFSPADGQPVGLYGTLIGIMDTLENNYGNIPEEDKALAECYINAWITALQTPLFCTLNDTLSVEVATMLMAAFNNSVKEFVDNAETKEETEEDIRKNTEMEKAMKLDI